MGAQHEACGTTTAAMPRKPKPKPKPDRLIERDGALCKPCWSGGCPFVRPVEEFAPRNNEANLALFLQAAALYRETKSVAARATIVQHATSSCDYCRDSTKRSEINPKTKKGKCRAYWQELQKTTFHTCVGCGGTRSIEADNVVSDAERAELYARGKVLHPKHHCLGDYGWWAKNGGVHGMRLEKTVCLPRCRMCHALQPTSNPRVDPSTLPPPVLHESVADPNMYVRRWHATKIWPRYVYNDALKRGVGECENLNCARDGPGGGYCIAGVERAFDWEHDDAGAKKAGISVLCGTLRANMSEAEWKAAIHAELERGACRLLCKNCHHLKTSHKIAPVYVPVRALAALGLSVGESGV